MAGESSESDAGPAAKTGDPVVRRSVVESQRQLLNFPQRRPRDQVAAHLGVTLNNVTVRLHRGRTLRKRLEEMCLTCPTHGFLDCGCDEAERARRRRTELPGVPDV